MNLISSLSYIVGRLSELFNGAWTATEPVFEVLYLAALAIVPLWVWRQKGTGARLLSAALFILLLGEGYRLVPRIVASIVPQGPPPEGGGR